MSAILQSFFDGGSRCDSKVLNVVENIEVAQVL